MDITNPLEPVLNLSYNVNKTAVKMFKEKCSSGVEKMDILKDVKNTHGPLHQVINTVFFGQVLFIGCPEAAL